MSNSQLLAVFVIVIVALPFVAYFVLKFGAVGFYKGKQLAQKEEREDDGEEKG